MLVLDSARSVLHSELIKGKTAAELNFAYTLRRNNLPPGKLLFRFEIRGLEKTTTAAHTVYEIGYQLETSAIVSQIVFEKEVRLGQTVSVTATPSSFPDKRLVAFDVSSPAVLDARKFFLDIRTIHKTVVRSIAGKSVGGGKYVFSYKLEPLLESLGTQVLSFRYRAEDGRDFVLAPYDTMHGELIEGSSSLQINVLTKLTLTNVKSMPTATDFFYGNEVAFVFTVKDAISNQVISLGNNRGAESGPHIYLTLQHRDPLRDFTSATVMATKDTDSNEFSIIWKISPNAVRGAGVLVLTARGYDGIDVPLMQDDASVRIDVTVGGEIDVQKTTWSTSNPDTFNTVQLV
jgi:hypothetical protein